MLRTLLLIMALVGLLFAQENLSLKQDIEWLIKMEKKYDTYISNLKESYFKEYESDVLLLNELREEYKVEKLPNNNKLKKQFQETSFKMKKFVKSFETRVERSIKLYQNAYIEAVFIIKRAEDEKNRNMLIGSKQQYAIAKDIFENRIKNVVSNIELLANIQKELDCYEKKYKEISLDIK